MGLRGQSLGGRGSICLGMSTGLFIGGKGQHARLGGS